MAAPLLGGPASPGDVLDATVWSWAHPVAASDVIPEAGGDVLHWLVGHGRLWSAAHANGWRRIGQSDVRRAHEVRDRLKDLDNSLGGGAVLPMALGYVRQEIPAMLGGRYDDKTGRALVRAIAELTLDIGWMAYDAGNQPEARRQMLQALHLAQVAGDRLFGGRVAAAMSHQALHLGRVAEAVDLAEAARSGTRQVASPTASAMFSAMQACAFAAEHDQRRSFDALRVAEEAMQRARPDEDLPGWLDFDDGAVAGHAARAMCTLGSPGQAQAFARYAVAHCRPGHRRTLAQREALLANALYQAHDLEQAVAVGEKVLEEAWQLHSDQVRHDVTQLSGLLRASKSRAVWRFVRQAEELARATAPRYSFTTT
jgi:hypothetical protein